MHKLRNINNHLCIKKTAYEESTQATLIYNFKSILENE